MGDVSGRVFLFRHGQTTYNRDKRFTGWFDSRLTSKGKSHARLIAGKLKSKKVHVAIHTSLSRSKDTLRPVLDSHPECVFVLEDDRMIERSYGVLQGMFHEQFIRRVGKQEFDLRVEGDALTDIEDPVQVRSIKRLLGSAEFDAIHRGWRVAAPEGESFADVEKRVRSFIRDLKSFIRRNKVNVAISAHGNSIRLFRKVMENASVEDAVSWSIPYDKVFEYKI